MNTPASSLQTRPSLLMRIRDAQDAQAWNAFVDLYAPAVFRYCRAKHLQDADAADLTQEVMTQVAQSIRAFEYQPDKGRFRHWLGVIVHRRLIRFWRKQNDARAAVNSELVDSLAGPPPDAEWTDEFHAQVLRVALERIRPHFEAATWRAFERVWLDHCTAAETSAELQVPIEMVYVSKSRVLKRLEEEVLELADDYPQMSPPR